MQIVLALGNPGSEYEKTRHNAGWIALGCAFPELTWSFEKKFDAEISEITLANEITIFARPLTFMNESGKTALALKNFYNVAADHISVIYDDVDVVLGRIEISHGKGDGGHNGVGSVIDRLATRHFTRIRIGIGEDHTVSETASNTSSRIPRRVFVLGKLAPHEYEILKNISPDLRRRIELIVKNGRDNAMNEYN